MKKNSLKSSTVPNIDHYIKKFTAYNFLQLFIIAQLNEAVSLRDLSKQTKDQEEIQTFIDIDSISASSFPVNKALYHQSCLKKCFDILCSYSLQ